MCHIAKKSDFFKYKENSKFTSTGSTCINWHVWKLACMLGTGNCCLCTHNWDGIFKLLRSPGIISKKSIPPADVAWRVGTTTAEYTEWQWPLSGVHSIMMVKSAQPGKGGGCTPTPFTLYTITIKVVVYAPAERAETLPLFLLYPYMYSVTTLYPYMYSVTTLYPYMYSVTTTLCLLGSWPPQSVLKFQHCSLHRWKRKENFPPI
jgi:hypothetical protein